MTDLIVGNLIKYGELKAKTLEMIKAKCCNIETWKDVSPKLIDGATFDIARTSRCAAVATVSDNVLKIVSDSTVTNDFNNFLTSRGIVYKNDEVISFKAMMNYFNNVSSFIATKLVTVSNSFGSGKYIFYNSQNNSYPAVNTGKDIDFTPSDVSSTINEMLGIINNVSKIHYPTTNITYTCSSSSSSSSSSSCSSSSSLFIAYMEI